MRLAALVENFDHMSDDFRDHRMAFYDYLHQRRIPILRSEHYGGFWYVPKYEVAVAIQRNPELFSNKRFTIPERPVPGFIPATLDPPEHSAYKQVLAQLFTPKQAAELVTQITALAEDLIRSGIRAGSFDMVVDVMLPLMANVTATYILGLDVDRIESYSTPIHHLTQRDYPAEKAAEELAWLNAQFAVELAHLRETPRGLLGRLCQISFQGRPFADQELQMIAMNLLTGGVGTTSFFMGSVTVFLGRHDEYRRQLIESPSQMSAAIEELLRAFTPTQNFGRSVTRDTQIAGRNVREGEKVLVGYGAANFDPDVFSDPQRIDFSRRLTSPMSFGLGPHRCLGSHLAKQVATIVTATLLSFAPDYRLQEERLCQNPASAAMLGYQRVPIMAGASCLT